MVWRQGLAALVLMLLAGCASIGGALDFDDPEIELLALEPLPSQGLEARFLVKLRVLNPNPVPLAISGVAYDVFIRDAKILSGVSNEGINVGAYSESVAELEVAAGMLGSLTLLRDLMANPTDGALPYKLNAKLSLSGLSRAIRISREGSIDLSGRP
ncbi:Conserved secreted protein [Congregibacter litoralis KT71]|uniref:Conserved secreted protein n=2 Tax=Congregibacter TaxID=393661 RepID=A4A8T8_9GAMM|nr:Conserved secreted protein [Congregibacter litoralis KT71]